MTVAQAAQILAGWCSSPPNDRNSGFLSMRKLPGFVVCFPSLLHLCWLISAILICSGASPAAAADPPGWKAGLAKAVITPDTSVWLAGYGGRRPPDGKLH